MKIHNVVSENNVRILPMLMSLCVCVHLHRRRLTNINITFTVGYCTLKAILMEFTGNRTKKSISIRKKYDFLFKATVLQEDGLQ